jgi:hypothetical protein
MRVIYDYDFNNRKDADILIRVYENQEHECKPVDAYLAEVRFKSGYGLNPYFFNARTSRWIATDLVKTLLNYEPSAFTLGISNEFTGEIEGIPTREMFNLYFKAEAKRYGLPLLDFNI